MESGRCQIPRDESQDNYPDFFRQFVTTINLRTPPKVGVCPDVGRNLGTGRRDNIAISDNLTMLMLCYYEQLSPSKSVLHPSLIQPISTHQPRSHQIDSFFDGGPDCFDADDEVCWFIRWDGKRIVDQCGGDCELARQISGRVRIDG